MREFIEGYIASRNGGSGVSIGSIAQQGSQTETGTQPSATGANKLAEREICSPTTGSTATQTPPKQPSPPKADNGSVEIFITEWMPGGHNQNEACARGIQEFQKKFPNKTLTRVGSNEESRKDWMGHVEYKYYCTIRVGG